jgi:hypothetical protein
MSVSYVEQFYGTDWERYSQFSAKFVSAGCIVISILSLVMKFNFWVGAYTLMVGLFLAAFEFPILYVCIPQCDLFRTKAVEALKLDSVPAVKGALLVLLSIVTFMGKTLCILAGIFMIIAGILLGFAQVNKTVDAADTIATDEEAAPSKTGVFGTF